MPFEEDPERRFVLMRLAVGRSLPFWIGALEIQRIRIRELIDELPEVRAELATKALSGPVFAEWSLRCSVDAHYALVGVAHVLRLARWARENRPKDDSRVEDAYTEFTTAHREAETIRGRLEHWDTYWVGGETDRKRGIDNEHTVFTDIVEDELVLTVGTTSFKTMKLAGDAIELARVAAQVAWEGISPPSG